MKIFILQGRIGINGVFYLNIELIKQFIILKHNVSFLTQGVDQKISNIIPKNCNLIVFKNSRLKIFLYELIKFLKNEKPNVIIASGWPYSIIAILAIKLLWLKCKIIVVEHVDFRTNLDISGEYTIKDKFLIKNIAGYIYKLADSVVGVSQGVIDGLTYVTKTKLYNSKVIYNPVREFKCVDNEKNIENKISKVWTKETKKILSVGRLAKQKSFDTLINAIELLYDIEDLVLIIAGEGSERTKLESLIEKKHLSKRVILIGEIANPSILYENADLFVLSSSSEGFANVIVEALHFGVPIVSTDCMSGPSEILENGRWGKLVAVGNHFMMAEEIRNILSTNNDKELLRRRAENFLPSNVAKQYLNLM